MSNYRWDVNGLKIRGLRYATIEAAVIDAQNYATSLYNSNSTAINRSKPNVTVKIRVFEMPRQYIVYENCYRPLTTEESKVLSNREADYNSATAEVEKQRVAKQKEFDEKYDLTWRIQHGLVRKSDLY